MEAKKYIHGDASHGIHCREYETGPVRLHWHSFYEIELVLSGEGEHTVNGCCYPWRRGEMHLLRLSDLHKIEAERSRVFLIQIDPGCMPARLMKRISLRRRAMVTYLEQGPLQEMETLCRMLLNAEDAEIRENLLQLILLVFLRALEEQPLAEDSGERLGELLLYIGEHFREELTPASLAEQFYMNKTYFCTYFKKHTGKTVVHYINSLRLEYAAELAVTTTLSTTEIAEAAGFGSVSHFLRSFKKKFGVSPMEMRKRKP